MTRTVGYGAAAALVLALASHISPAAADAPCDGVYRSSGRACHGAAIVRNKTIEWNATFSVCKPSPYEVLDSTLEGDELRVAYRFMKRSKSCRHEVMEITGERDGYWNIVGYTTLEAYQRRNDKEWVMAGEKAGEFRAPDYCPVMPMASERCNFDFARKPK